MIRTQIQLTDEQYAQLKALTLQNKKSLAELIRLAVDQLLVTQQHPDRAALYQQAETVIGKYAAQTDDIAVEHDRYLDEAFAS